MYSDVWKMNGKNCKIKFFKIMPLQDMNVMYIKVVELVKAYLITDYQFKIY